MDIAKQVDGESFVTWPMPSPTSRLGINLRFYSIDEGGQGARYRADIGVENERLLEKLYFDFNLEQKSVTPQQFEETTRGLFQQRIGSVNAYGIVTTLYVAYTTDPSEVKRLARREQRVVASQKRRFPYMAYSQYQTIPTTFWGAVKWYVGGLLARLFH